MDEVLSEALFWELERSNGHLIWDMLTVHFFFFLPPALAVNKSEKKTQKTSKKSNRRERLPAV